MTDEELLLKTTSSTYMSLESNPVIDSTAPPVETTHPNNPAGVEEEIQMVMEPTLQHNQTTTLPMELSSQTSSTGDEPIALQDSPVASNSLEVSKETALQTESDMAEMDNNNNLPEPSALDGNAADDGRRLSYDESGHSQDPQAEEEQAEGADTLPNELQLTASEGPRPHGGLAEQFKESQQQQELTLSSQLSPVQIESHLLSSEEPLTSSPTTSNPNTPDSTNQMAGGDNVIIGTGGDADTGTIIQTAAKPVVVDETLPNPFEFIPPSSFLGVPSHPHTPVSSLSNRSSGNVQRLPSVLRPANRHTYDTEGVRRASMVAGWDFAPPTLFATAVPEDQFSPKYRAVSLEVLRSDSYSTPPSRPQSSASWYPQYHRINSQPVYVDTVPHSHLQPHHQKFSTQPAYPNGSGNSSFVDFAETPDFRLSTPGREQQVGDEQSERTASVPLNEMGLATKQGNENTMEEHDKPCTDQGKKQRWKFWSRNKQPTCPNNTRAEKTKSANMPAEKRLKLKKRLSRNLLEGTN